MDLDDLLDRVAQEFHVPTSYIKKGGRRLEYLVPRHVFFLLAYNSGHTYKEIGDYMGFDHSSVINGVEKVKTHPNVQDRIDRILNQSSKHFDATLTLRGDFFLNYSIK